MKKKVNIEVNKRQFLTQKQLWLFVSGRNDLSLHYFVE